MATVETGKRLLLRIRACVRVCADATILSESILALQAPTTSRCDFCQVSFCGIGVPGRCVAAPLMAQHLHGLADLGDLIQCSELYDIFEGNAVEVEIMLDYLTTQGFTPRHIYREVCRALSFPLPFPHLGRAWYGGVNNGY